MSDDYKGLSIRSRIQAGVSASMPNEAESMKGALSRLLMDQSKVDAVLVAIDRDEQRLSDVLTRAEGDFGLVVPANATGVDRILPLYDFAEAIGAIDRIEVDEVPLAAVLDRIEQRLLTQVSVERFQQKVKEHAGCQQTGVNEEYSDEPNYERDKFIWENIVGSNVTELSLALKKQNFSPLTTSHSFNKASRRWAKYRRYESTRTFKKERPMTEAERRWQP